MKKLIKRLLFPARSAAARFVDIAPNRHSIIYKAANMIAGEKVEGDYLEFGVYRGTSVISAYKTLEAVFALHRKVNPGRTLKDAGFAQKQWNAMRFICFDSFEGLPDLSGADTASKCFAKGKYACGKQEFIKNLKYSDIPLNKVVIEKGWFENTCTPETMLRHKIKSVAIAHIDSDLYASAKIALNFVKPLIVEGTIIIFDDWYSFRANPDKGEQKAFAEFKREMSGWDFVQYQKEGTYRNSFIVVKK